jgi:TonB-dependent SusC/RagA subfamily outer membrane receptor
MRRILLTCSILALVACRPERLLLRPAVVPSNDERVALTASPDVLYILDGRILPRGDSAGVPAAVRALDPARIRTIEVLKGAKAKQAYGDAGSSGVVIITTKSDR